MSSKTLLSSNQNIIQSIEVSGFPIEVGILRDGTPFLSGRGLARACGISNSTLVGWGEITPKVGDRHRAGKMANLLATYGYRGDRFFFKIPDGSIFEGKANVSAYPYQVCMAFLDYYAFEANKEEARNSLRILSEKQLPQFILEAIDHPSPEANKPKSTRSYPRLKKTLPLEKRPLRNGVPISYFTVAQRMSDKTERSHQPDPMFDTTVQNIQRAWNRYWDVHKLWEQYGDRFEFPSQEFSYFPQAKTYVYPNLALSAFQQWLNLKYIPERFPSYLQRKIKQRGCETISIYLLPQAS